MAEIVLIDDDENMRKTLADCLDGAGYVVTQAGNGKAGLQLIENATYDLIIMDVFMPEMDGIELVQRLQKVGGLPPIITISGGGGVLPPSWATKLTEVYGVAAALTKPIDMTHFLSTVEQALKR